MSLHCGAMMIGTYDEMDWSALTAHYAPSVEAPSGWGIDYASYVFSRLPLALLSEVKDAYNGTYTSVADEVNRALDSLQHRDRITILNWLYKAGKKHQKICWRPNAPNHFHHYLNGYAALVDYLIDPSSIDEDPRRPKRFHDLPRGFPRTDQPHCIEPSNDEYDSLAGWIGNWPSKSLTGSDHTHFVSIFMPSNPAFQSYMEDAGGAMARVIREAARETYEESGAHPCHTSVLLADHCMPSDCPTYLMAVRVLVARKFPFCVILESGVDGKPEHCWIDGF